MESAYFKLLLGDLDRTKDAIDSSHKILDQLDSVDLVVYASFYRVSGDYYKVRLTALKDHAGTRERGGVDSIAKLTNLCSGSPLFSGQGRVCGLLQELVAVPGVRERGQGLVPD